MVWISENMQDPNFNGLWALNDLHSGTGKKSSSPLHSPILLLWYKLDLIIFWPLYPSGQLPNCESSNIFRSKLGTFGHVSRILARKKKQEVHLNHAHCFGLPFLKVYIESSKIGKFSGRSNKKVFIWTIYYFFLQDFSASLYRWYIYSKTILYSFCPEIGLTNCLRNLCRTFGPFFLAAGVFALIFGLLRFGKKLEDESPEDLAERTRRRRAAMQNPNIKANNLQQNSSGMVFTVWSSLSQSLFVRQDLWYPMHVQTLQILTIHPKKLEELLLVIKGLTASLILFSLSLVSKTKSPPPPPPAPPFWGR